MSVISDAFLRNMLEQGMPVIIIPESFLEKEETLEESFSESLRNRFKKKRLSSTTIIPSPSPG